MPTLGDAFRVYIKPSLGGLLVIRKRNVNRQSPAVIKIMNILRGKAGATDHPAKLAHRDCHDKHKVIVYVPGEGYKVVWRCKAKTFYSLLSKHMTDLIAPHAKSRKSEVLGALGVPGAGPMGE